MFFIYNTYQKVIANCTIEDSTMARNKEPSKKSGTVASINDSLKKATTEMLVLFVLHQKSMYTYEMMNTIEKLSEGRLMSATVRM